MRYLKYLLLLFILICVLIISAVSWHSIEEIHYLKSFYPERLSVEDAFHAAWVEVLKIHIISLPLLTIILICAFLLWLYKKRE
ncbi:MAG: hypothetical protein HYS21_13985 [Deltaproteobacteria bacterium]|nr:hypothetical protein [Deltaproteobacteria bacterium]